MHYVSMTVVCASNEWCDSGISSPRCLPKNAMFLAAHFSLHFRCKRHPLCCKIGMFHSRISIQVEHAPGICIQPTLQQRFTSNDYYSAGLSEKYPRAKRARSESPGRSTCGGAARLEKMRPVSVITPLR